jgi:hypothetical protein
MTPDELIKWHFDELIKTLITLSSSAQRQKEIMGFGAVADEMAMDFDSHYTSVKEQYLSRNILNSEHEKALDHLDEYLTNKSGDKDPDFWDDDLLDKNSDWNYVRENAMNILKLLHKDHLEIKIERTVENTRSEKGEPLIIERTFAKLIDKNVS